MNLHFSLMRLLKYSFGISLAFLNFATFNFAFAEDAFCESRGWDFNSATSEQLQTLTGIGPATAENIINSRSYDSVDDLIKAKGIGDITLQKIKDQCDDTSYVAPSESTTDSSTKSTSNSSTKTTSSNNGNNDEYRVQSNPITLGNFVAGNQTSTDIGNNRLGAIHSPITFKTNLTNTKSVKCEWSFGDGSRSTKCETEHSYDFAGDYTAVLNLKNDAKEGVSVVKVKVVEPKLQVVWKNDFVEIENLGNKNINLGFFTFKSSRGKFELSRDTILAAKNSLKLSLSRLSSVVENIDKIFFVYPDGTILAEISRPMSATEFNEIVSKIEQLQNHLDDVRVEQALSLSKIPVLSTTGEVVSDKITEKTSAGNLESLENSALEKNADENSEIDIIDNFARNQNANDPRKKKTILSRLFGWIFE